MRAKGGDAISSDDRQLLLERDSIFLAEPPVNRIIAGDRDVYQRSRIELDAHNCVCRVAGVYTHDKNGDAKKQAEKHQAGNYNQRDDYAPLNVA